MCGPYIDTDMRIPTSSLWQNNEFMLHGIIHEDHCELNTVSSPLEEKNNKQERSFPKSIH